MTGENEERTLLKNNDNAELPRGAVTFGCGVVGAIGAPFSIFLGFSMKSKEGLVLSLALGLLIGARKISACLHHAFVGDL